jgi:hypothetical protein
MSKNKLQKTASQQPLKNQWLFSPLHSIVSCLGTLKGTVLSF